MRKKKMSVSDTEQNFLHSSSWANNLDLLTERMQEVGQNLTEKEQEKLIKNLLKYANGGIFKIERRRGKRINLRIFESGKTAIRKIPRGYLFRLDDFCNSGYIGCEGNARLALDTDKFEGDCLRLDLETSWRYWEGERPVASRTWLAFYIRPALVEVSDNLNIQPNYEIYSAVSGLKQEGYTQEHIKEISQMFGLPIGRTLDGIPRIVYHPKILRNRKGRYLKI